MANFNPIFCKKYGFFNINLFFILTKRTKQAYTEKMGNQKTAALKSDAKKKTTDFPVYDLFYFSNTEFGTHIIQSGLVLHSHNFWEFTYVLNGAVKHYVNFDYSEILSPGYIVLFRPSDIHSFDDLDDEICNHRDIMFSNRLFKEICDFIDPGLFDRLLGMPAPVYIPISEENQKDLEEAFAHYNDIDKDDLKMRYSVARSIGAYLLMLHNFYLYQTHEKQSNEVKKILTMMKSTAVLKKGIAQLVSQTGYSHGHLCRLFKTQMGKTLTSYLTENRMHYAAALLKNTNMILLDVAARVGYENPSHFITVFKKYYGLTPHQYKNKLKKESERSTLSAFPVTQKNAYAAFGNFLREKRLNCADKVSAAVIAKKAGISQEYYTQLEKGEKLTISDSLINAFTAMTKLSDNDKKTLLRLAEETQKMLTDDIINFLTSTEFGPVMREALHKTMSGNISKNDWENFILSKETSENRSE